MKNNFYFLLIILIYTSCIQKKQKSEIDKPEIDTKENIKIESVETKTSINKEKQAINYNGKIGKNLDVYFHMSNDNGNLTGFYFYRKTGIDIEITGNIKEDNLTIYELNYKKDTTAVIKGKMANSQITGKWISATSNKEYPIVLQKTTQQIPPLPNTIEGKYFNEYCDLLLTFSKSKGEYSYGYKSNKRSITGKVNFYRDVNELYINLTNIEYAEDYFDIELPEEDPEKEKEFERLKQIGKRTMGVDCYFTPDEITIQNYGNAMNYYVKLYDCGEKYIHFKRQ